MTMTIEKIDAEIAIWERSRDNWLRWHGGLAYLSVMACQDEIKKLRRQRDAAQQTERK